MRLDSGNSLEVGDSLQTLIVTIPGFLQGFGTASSSSRRQPEPANVEARYQTQYEQRLDPFTTFSNQERQKRYLHNQLYNQPCFESEFGSMLSFPYSDANYLCLKKVFGMPLHSANHMLL